MSKKCSMDIQINNYLKKEDKKLLKFVRRKGVTISNDLIFEIIKRICDLIERHDPAETSTSEEENYYIRDLNHKNSPYDFTPNLIDLEEFRNYGNTQDQEKLISSIFEGFIDYTNTKIQDNSNQHFNEGGQEYVSND